MKKIKWYLIAVAVVGIGSAFGTKISNQGTLTLVGKNLSNPSNPYPVVQAADEGSTWMCENTADTCLFTPKSGAIAPYDRSELDPIPERIGKKFKLLP